MLLTLKSFLKVFPFLCCLCCLMATHSSTFVWKIPWMKEPGRLQSMGSQRVGQDWVTSLSLLLMLSLSLSLSLQLLIYSSLFSALGPAPGDRLHLSRGLITPEGPGEWNLGLPHSPSPALARLPFPCVCPPAQGHQALVLEKEASCESPRLSTYFN